MKGIQSVEAMTGFQRRGTNASCLFPSFFVLDEERKCRRDGERVGGIVAARLREQNSRFEILLAIIYLHL